MTVKIKSNFWKEELIIETSNGIAKVYERNNEIVVQNEKVLDQIGLTVGDAISLFFDKAASEYTKKNHPAYTSHKKGSFGNF